MFKTANKMIGGAALGLSLIFTPFDASALKRGDLKGDTIFKVDGQNVDELEALRADMAGKTVYRCKPKDFSGKKFLFTASGDQVQAVVECSLVEAVSNPKSGGISWKVKK